MSHRAQKSKRNTQPRTPSQPLRPVSAPLSSSNLVSLSSTSELVASISSATTTNEAPAFIAGPGATTFQPPISLAQLAASAKTNPAPAWPINDLLPEGLCLLAAKPHAGSHTLALQLALSVARGTLALDHFDASAGEALYLGFHETENVILARTQHLLGDETLPKQLSWSNTWQDWQHDGLDALSSWLDEHPLTRLLVIDSFSHLLPPGTSTRRAYQLLRQLNHLAHTRHLCILLLHSLARVSAKDPFSSIPCSPLLLETCETLAILDHDRGSEQATLHLTGNALSTRALSLALPAETTRWSLDNSSPPAPLSTETLPHTPSFVELLAPFMSQSLHDLASDDTTPPTIAISDSSVTPTLSTGLSGGGNPVSDTSNASVTPASTSEMLRDVS